MSRENLELLRRYYDAWNSRDTDAVVAGEVSATPVELIDAGESVVALVHMRLRQLASGERVE